MARAQIPEADAILDKEYPVLDKGFVRIVDYLGGDDRIVQAARVSYGGGTKNYREDRALIRYLLRNDHTSPFEQVNFTFHLKMPIFVARQWIRHRTASVNEISGRYSVMKDEFYVPQGENIAAQSDDNKQGRSNEPVEPELQDRVRSLFRDEQQRVYETYSELIDHGVARELARIDLPLSMYTEFYWQMDLHNLFRFLRLRMDSHAQYEIRVYAETLYGIITKVCPVACEAFEEYVVGAIRFSRSEVEAIKRLIRGEEAGLADRDLERFTNKLERGRE